jgi:excisionase family DNA binding protein
MLAKSSIPFADHITCTVAEACEVSGLGRTKIYEALTDGRLASTKIDNRRLIIVASLFKLLEPERPSDAA